MYLAPLNYDRFFKKNFSDEKITKRFLEDFFEINIQSIELLPLDHKLTNESSLVQFDYRYKVKDEYLIIDIQQWYKHDVVRRFYLYHAANSVLQLEFLPLKTVGKEKKVRDYSGLLPVKTLVWFVDDNLNFTEDYTTHVMLPQSVEDFLVGENLWSEKNCMQSLAKRNELLKIVNNDTKDLLFLKKNQLIFAFQRNIIKNQQEATYTPKPYTQWFEFAAKAKNKNNTKKDFTKFQEDNVFEEIIRKLNHSSLNQSERDYIYYYEELEGIMDVKWKEAKEEGIKEGLEKGISIQSKAVAMRCLKSGMSLEQTSFLSGLSIEEIEYLKNKSGSDFKKVALKTP